jgi:hypothetical protein
MAKGFCLGMLTVMNRTWEGSYKMYTLPGFLSTSDTLNLVGADTFVLDSFHLILP